MEIVFKMKNVAPREGSNILHFRKTIPENLHSHFGKTAHSESLETTDWREADRKAEPLRRLWKAKIKEARKGSNAISADELADRFIKQNIKGVDTGKLTEQYEEPFEMLMHIAALHATGTHPDLNRFLRHVEGIDNLDLSPIVLRLKELPPSDAVRLVMGIVNKIRDAFYDRTFLPAPEHDLPPQYSRIAKAALKEERERLANPPKDFLSKVLEATIDEDKEAREEGSMTYHIENLIEWFGDKPIDHYSRDDLFAYRNKCLDHLPRDRTTKARFKSLSLREAIAKATPAECIGHETIRNHITSIETVFKKAERTYKSQGFFIDLTRLKPKKKKPSHVDRTDKRFSLDELQEMINLLPEVSKSPARFWVPLIGLYQGARLNEICQLRTGDVTQEGDIWVLSFNEKDKERTKKQIKTGSSIRDIPVHSALLDLGFSTFVEDRKQETAGEDALLFRDVVWSKQHLHRRPVTRWFNEGFKQKFLLADRAKPLHFQHFRHTWNQQGQNQARMLKHIRHEMAGHTSSDAIPLIYTGYELAAAMLEELQKLDYGLDLSPIMGLY